MEEILASIRKIISDDTATPAATPPTPEPEIANDEDDDAATLEEVMFDEDVREDAREEAAEPEEVEAAFEVDDDAFEEEDVSFEVDEPAEVEPAESFESLLSASRSAEFSAKPAMESDSVAAPVFAAKPAPAPQEKKAMSASPAYSSAPLTDDTTANAAAGALGKLISKMDLGGDHTLEGLVREMLRPMIKEWLDANLPSIVEEKVEAEVQRISRMAR